MLLCYNKLRYSKEAAMIEFGSPVFWILWIPGALVLVGAVVSCFVKKEENS